MSEPRKALITGIRGQDGWFLARHLLSQGFQVYGLSRTAGALDHVSEASVYSVDITDAEAIDRMIREIVPDQVYHLAAHHHSSTDQPEDYLLQFDRFEKINFGSTKNLLHSLKKWVPQSRFFYAGSCHMFGPVDHSPQTEHSPMFGNAPYAITKIASMGYCRMLRERFAYFACTGVLYNHESWRRGPQFVTQKIVRQGIEVAEGRASKIEVGNLEAIVDWTYAGDTVRAMQKILELDHPQDFIIGSGKPKTVRDLALEVCRQLDLNPETQLVQTQNGGPQEHPFVANPQKLINATGWQPQTSMSEWISEMIKTSRSEQR